MRDSEEPTVVTESTGMSVGFILAMGAAIITLLCGAGALGVTIWRGGLWIGSLETKLDGIAMDLKIVKNDSTDLRSKVDNQENRITKIETAGSPQLQRVAEQLNALQRTVDIHESSSR